MDVRRRTATATRPPNAQRPAAQLANAVRPIRRTSMRGQAAIADDPDPARPAISKRAPAPPRRRQSPSPAAYAHARHAALTATLQRIPGSTLGSPRPSLPAGHPQNCPALPASLNFGAPGGVVRTARVAHRLAGRGAGTGARSGGHAVLGRRACSPARGVLRERRRGGRQLARTQMVSGDHAGDPTRGSRRLLPRRRCEVSGRDWDAMLVKGETAGEGGEP